MLVGWLGGHMRTSQALKHARGWPALPRTLPAAGQCSRRSAVQPPRWQLRPCSAAAGCTSSGRL